MAHDPLGTHLLGDLLDLQPAFMLLTAGHGDGVVEEDL